MNEIFKLFGTIGVDTSNAEKGIDSTVGKAKDAGSKITGFFKKAAIAIGTYFAVDKLVNFGKASIEAAASAKAIQAQFDQVFGNVGDQAQDTIDGMAKEFGMLPNRIKPSFTSATSMFKGLGLSTEEAMTQAKTAVTMAADAAAFYDMSYENANSALNSFIKGNYEGGEAIGLFANETQMASWAAKNLGLDWNNLDEAGKQVARLQFAQAMQEAAGATGQASRESDGYENQLGNLKQAWTDFKAVVGEPILGTAVAGLQNVTGWLQTAGQKVQDFQGWLGNLKDDITSSTAFTSLRDVFQEISDKVQGFFDKVSESGVFDTFVQKMGELKDDVLAIDFNKLATDASNFLNAILPLVAGITGAAAAFGIYTLALHAKSAAETIAIVSMYAMDAAGKVLGATMAFLTSPIGIVVVAIGALIAIGVLLWQNWDTIKAKAGELKDNVVNKITELKNGFVNKVNELKDGAVNKFNELRDKAGQVMEKAKEKILSPIQKARDKIGEIVDNIKGFFSGLKLKLPKIEMPKLPHFSLKGEFSLKPPSVPKLSVDWYADGGIMTTPTLFGFNGRNAMVGGEAGPEAILPLNDETLGAIGRGIAATMNSNQSNRPIVLMLNDKVLGQVIGDVSDQEGGVKIRRIDRGLAT